MKQNGIKFPFKAIEHVLGVGVLGKDGNDIINYKGKGIKLSQQYSLVFTKENEIVAQILDDCQFTAASMVNLS